MLQTVLLYIYIDIYNYIHLKNYLNYRYFRRNKIRLKSQTPPVFFSIWSIISTITFPELRLLKQLGQRMDPFIPSTITTPSSGTGSRHECNLVLPEAPGSSNRFTIETEWSLLVDGWTNPSEKYARQNGNLPQVRVKIKNTWNHQLACFDEGLLFEMSVPSLTTLTKMLWRIDSWKIIFVFKMVPFLGTSSFSLGSILEII